MGYIFWRAARAQPRVRPSSAHQSIFLIMEMIFDYLIASLAQKSEKIQSFEFLTILKILKFFEIFEILKIFEIFYKMLKFQTIVFFRLFELS